MCAQGEILQGFLCSLPAWPAEREKETPVARSAWQLRTPTLVLDLPTLEDLAAVGIHCWSSVIPV